MDHKNKYIKVRVILIYRTKDAIAVDIAPESSDEVETAWIPLSLIHGSDEPKIGKDHSTDVVEFRLVDWKDRELGLD